MQFILFKSDTPFIIFIIILHINYNLELRLFDVVYIIFWIMSCKVEGQKMNPLKMQSTTASHF